MKGAYLFLTIFALVAVIMIFGCTQTETGAKNLTIGDILSNPQLYQGKEVTLNGKYGGWGGGQCNNTGAIAMKTRSDTIIYDDTGCIYMAVGEVKIISAAKELDPWDKSTYDTEIQIKAKVSLIDGKPILGN